ncbi:MAG: LPS export ABC transporter ATP-binding protein [Blastocatellia bacterium]|nr:LPS export ABC transporter ATP-binding protein [Blastocatellia bacterium]MCX7751410.1 LPS export ABC transporter ATP-binding protein [Blastocatellia bacterium]MDW8169123.1 LPS export ABC transporter ATP-binding protein [Acidobacteriota bacterium]
MSALITETKETALGSRPSSFPDWPHRDGTTLRASGLTKYYRGRCVLRDVSLEVHPGEIVGLLGPNGAGKTTTFHLLVGIEVPDRGAVFLDGREITTLPMYLRARRGLVYLPQEPSIFRRLTVEENILAVLERQKLSRAERQRRLEEVLEDLGLTSVRRVKGYALSGGERRRTEIARALVMEPRFLLLDEPLTGIDPLAVADLQRIIVRLKERGIGILITDHNVREMLRITDRAYLLSEGRIFRAGTPEVLTEDPEVRRVYLGEHFRL